VEAQVRFDGFATPVSFHSSTPTDASAGPVSRAHVRAAETARGVINGRMVIYADLA
jgi:hypothetical protein